MSLGNAYRTVEQWLGGSNGPFAHASAAEVAEVMDTLIKRGAQPDMNNPMYLSRTDINWNAWLGTHLVTKDGFQTMRATDLMPIMADWTTQPYPTSGAGNLIGWVNYGNGWAPLIFTRTGSGFTVINGLMSGPNNSPGTVFNLPEQYRPAAKMTYLHVSNGPGGYGVGRFDVYPTGEVRMVFCTDPHYMSSTVVFPNVQADLEWKPITEWFNGWTNYRISNGGADTTWPDASVAVDLYGRVWFRGLIGGGTVPTTVDLKIAELPAGVPVPSEGQTHHPGLSNASTYASYDIRPDRGIYMKVGTHSLATNWSSLCNISYPTDHVARAKQMMIFSGNGWANYTESGAFPKASVSRYPDGLRGASGLIRSGSAGVTIGTFNEFDRVDRMGHRMFTVNAANALGRLDYESNGNMVLRNGSNLWVSLDGIWSLAGV